MVRSKEVLPDLDPLNGCRDARPERLSGDAHGITREEAAKNIPVIMYVEPGQETDKIWGCARGPDYIVKAGQFG